MGTRFEQAPAWNLGNKWRWMNPFAVLWTAIITVIFSLPFVPSGVPWNTTGGDGDGKFDLVDVNYAPVMVLLVLIIVGIWWKVSAHKYFTGQVRQVELEEALHERDDDPPAGGNGPTAPAPQPGPTTGGA